MPDLQGAKLNQIKEDQSMTHYPTPFEVAFPHLSQLFAYWTFEADSDIHSTAACIEALFLLIHSCDDQRWKLPVETLLSMLQAAESSAKDAKPWLDEWEAVEHKFLDTKEEARKIRERNIYGA
tara:strand:- start:285 stop:653 length:369 start_codon:yes stop_codon:yes gene_type:complete